MSHLCEDDAERSAWLGISEYLRIRYQSLVAYRVNLGELLGTVLQEKVTDLSGEAITGLFCQNRSDFFEGECLFRFRGRGCFLGGLCWVLDEVLQGFTQDGEHLVLLVVDGRLAFAHVGSDFTLRLALHDKLADASAVRVKAVQLVV